MKRFHVRITVNNLETSVAFYSKLFGQTPSKHEPDYAKWMLDDPQLNFALSSRGHQAGINHFGMQADTPEELNNLKALADDASNGNTRDQGIASCCYANSEKHWTIDPQGLAWEHFITMSDADAGGEYKSAEMSACCIPLRLSDESDTETESESCCIPNGATQSQTKCCG